MNQIRFEGKRGKTFEGNIKNITGLKILGICNVVELQQRLFVGSVLLRDLLHGASGFHHVPVVHHLRSIHLIAATRQRNPQLLPYFNQIRIRNVVHRLNLLIRHQSREHLRRDVVQSVVLLHSVHRPVVRNSGSVRAAAAEGDDDLVLRGYALVRWGRGREGVGAE